MSIKTTNYNVTLDIIQYSEGAASAALKYSPIINCVKPLTEKSASDLKSVQNNDLKFFILLHVKTSIPICK